MPNKQVCNLSARFGIGGFPVVRIVAVVVRRSGAIRICVLQACPVKGKHVEEYAKKLAGDKEKHEKQFSAYLKNKLNPSDISTNFEDIKNKILKGGN